MKKQENECLSDKVQKLYEKNPTKILEKIREENKKQNKEEKIINNNSKYQIHQYLDTFNEKENIRINKDDEQNSEFSEVRQNNLNIDEFIISNNLDIYNNQDNTINNLHIQSEINSKIINNINNNVLNINVNQQPKINNIIIPQINHNFSNNFIYNEIFPIKVSNKDEKNINIIYNPKKILHNLQNYWGSIYLQNTLYSMNNKEISILLSNLLPFIHIIMCLDYGNYYFQKLVKKLNFQEKLKIYQAIEPYFLTIAQNTKGTHSIQSLFEEIKTPVEQLALDNLLNKNMLLLFNDKNGYHIIMKIIMERQENQRNNINYFLISNIEKIAINPYGSYCINKFISNNVDINLRNLLINNIHKNVKVFFTKKCSCSILLLLLKYFNINSCEFIFEEIIKNLNDLILRPISISFVYKILLYLKNSNVKKLNNIIWKIFKNTDLVKELCKNINGEQLLNQLIIYSNISQQNYIKYILTKIKDEK